MNKIQISNPLTIIGVFAGLSEVAMVTALPFIRDDLQSIFVWFIMLFPLVLVGLFFWTLNKNPKVMYAPSDFRDENLFIENMKLGTVTTHQNNIPQTEIKEVEKIRNKKFIGQDVMLDNKEYNNCEFSNCRMIFSGSGPIGLINCNLNEVSWEFSGSAAQTLNFLSSINTEFGEIGKGIFESTVVNLREGTFA